MVGQNPGRSGDGLHGEDGAAAASRVRGGRLFKSRAVFRIGCESIRDPTNPPYVVAPPVWRGIRQPPRDNQTTKAAENAKRKRFDPLVHVAESVVSLIGRAGARSVRTAEIWNFRISSSARLCVFSDDGGSSWALMTKSFLQIDKDYSSPVVFWRFHLYAASRILRLGAAPCSSGKM